MPTVEVLVGRSLKPRWVIRQDFYSRTGLYVLGEGGRSNCKKVRKGYRERIIEKEGLLC